MWAGGFLAPGFAEALRAQRAAVVSSVSAPQLKGFIAKSEPMHQTLIRAGLPRYTSAESCPKDFFPEYRGALMSFKESAGRSFVYSYELIPLLLSDLSDADLLVRPVRQANHIAWQL